MLRKSYLTNVTTLWIRHLFSVNDMDDPLKINVAPLSVVTSEKRLGQVLSTNWPHVNFDIVIRDT